MFHGGRFIVQKHAITDQFSLHDMPTRVLADNKNEVVTNHAIPGELWFLRTGKVPSSS